MGHMERPQIIVSNLEDIFPVTISEIVLKFQEYSVHYHMWRVMWTHGKNSSEPINELDEFVYVKHMHSFLYRAYYVCVLGKFDRPCRENQRALFGEIRRSDFHTIRHR